jgi:hypothetical protein
MRTMYIWHCSAAMMPTSSTLLILIIRPKAGLSSLGGDAQHSVFAPAQVAGVKSFDILLDGQGP